jgi:hypothetical protein
MVGSFLFGLIIYTHTDIYGRTRTDWLLLIFVVNEKRQV